MSELKSDQPRSHRPRIVHLISGLGVGGAERTLQGLVDELEARGFESIVISLSSMGETGREMQENGFQVAALNWKSGRFSLLGMIKLIRWIDRLQPDVLQCWMYHADLVGALLSYIKRTNGLLWNVRGTISSLDEFPISTRTVIRACSFLSNRPDIVIVNSEQGLQDHQAIGYKPRKWLVIHNGIDTQKFIPSQARRTSLRERLGITDDDRLIGCVARYHPKKGHHFLIQSFARLRELSDNVYLALVGPNVDENNSELMDQIRQAGVNDWVFLLGAKEKSEFIYPALDILAMPSQYGEGFPNVVAEAMSCGVPSVVTDVGDAALIVGDVGEVVVPGDIDGFCRALDKLANRMAAEQKELGRAVRDRIRKHFHFDNMAAKYERLYRGCVSRADVVQRMSDC